MTLRKTFLTASIAILAASALATPARGQVTIFPKRVVFSDRLRTAEVTLVNQGDRPLTYRIGLVEERMTPAGMLEAAEPAPAAPAAPAGSRPAIDLLRYSPRQVTVAPGTPQTIRLLLRKPEDLPPGEYRVHLLCRALPPETDGADVESLSGGNGLAVKVIPVPAVSIPVIIRHGDGLQVSARLSSLAFDPDARTLSYRLEREGDISVYGDLTATFQPDGGGPEQVVGRARGVAVYAELAAIEQRLTLDSSLRTAKGRLRLRFTSQPEDDGRGPAVSAEAETRIP